MKRTRGFKLVKVFKWVVRLRPRTKSSQHPQLGYQTRIRSPISKLCRLARSLKLGAKELCFPRSDPKYKRLGQDPFKAMKVPKGHLAIYVGGLEGHMHRVLVPVMYFNHPLFCDLLKEAEQVYGYNHQGGITLPCGMLELEMVQTRIAAAEHCLRQRRWRKQCY